MGAIVSCTNEIEDIFETTKPVDPPPKQDYDKNQYQPQNGYYQPPQSKFQPETFKQDNNQPQAEAPPPKTKAVPYQNQDYHKLKKHLKENGQLFVDPEFPPNAKSLFWSKKPPAGITWKRPQVF